MLTVNMKELQDKAVQNTTTELNDQIAACRKELVQTQATIEKSLVGKDEPRVVGK